MIRRIFAFVAAGIALACTFSCTNDKINEELPQSQEKLIHVSLSANSVGDTKTFVNEDLTVYWEADDEIAVYDGTAIRKFTISSHNETSAVFEGDVAEGTTEIVAAYPYALAELVEGELVLNSLAEQRVSQHNVAKGALTSRTDTTALGEVLLFRNQNSLLKFTVAESEAISSFELQGNNGETFSNGEKTLKLLPAGETFTAGNYYMALSPAVFKGGVRVIANLADKRYCYQKTESLSFERNSGYDLGNIAEKGEVMPKANTISNAAELKAFIDIADMVFEDETWTVVSDIDLSGTVLGSATTFRGVLDGGNFTLSNWTCDASLFAKTEKSSLIKNLNIANTCTINAKSGNFGILVSRMYGNMTACSNAADVNVENSKGEQHIFGSLVGRLEGSMDNCSNSGNFTFTMNPTAKTGKTNYIGGIVGFIGTPQTGVRLNNCVNNGKISIYMTGTDGTASYLGHSYVGGIAGSTAVNAGTSGNTSGYTKNYGIISNCQNNGDVEVRHPDGGNSYYGLTGGVIGYIEGSLEGCTNNGKVSFYNSMTLTSGKPSCGGIAGAISGSAENCTNSADIYFEGNFTNASNEYANTCIGNKFAALGGCFGTVGADSKSIVNCDNSGKIESNTTMKSSASSSCSYGGVIGNLVPTMTVDGCDNSGELIFVSNSKTVIAGGIIGYLGSSASTTKLTNCNNTAPVVYTRKDLTTNAYVGGITGRYNKGVHFVSCSNTQPVTSNAAAITIIGGISGNCNGEMSKCENTGDINVNNALAGSQIGLISGYYSGTKINGTKCSGTITCNNVAETSSVGLFLGATGTTTRTWEGATIDGTISGYPSAGYFAGKIAGGGITLGTEANPVIFRPTSTINDVAIAAEPASESLVPVQTGTFTIGVIKVE